MQNDSPFSSKTSELQAIIEKQNKELFYLKSIIKKIPGSVYWKDVQGRYLGCNDFLLQMAGIHDIRDIYNKTDDELPWKVVADDIRRVDLEVMESGQEVETEEHPVLENKQQISMLTKKAPLKDEAGDTVGIIGISVDITERKRITQELVEAKERAEAANKLKTEFIRNMQHDIRTPISGIWSVLNSYVQKPNPQELQEVLPLVVKAAEQLLNICNEVIDFENVAYGDERVQLTSILLIDLVNQVIDLNSAAVIARGLYLKLDIAENVPAGIISDEHRLKKILINLIGNAIKFTQTGGVTLRVAFLNKEKAKCTLRFMVEDTGVGIPSDKTEQIFEKFSRLNPSDTQLYKGSGLGLFIVKQFTEELGGHVSVSSVEGKGTCFTVDIDIDVSPDTPKSASDRYQYIVGVASEETKPALVPDAPKSKPAASIQTKQPQILMIEDDSLALFAAEQIWKQLGVSVHVDTAVNVQSARQLLKQKMYDLVLADLGLPDGSGDELAREVKHNAKHLNYRTPMVALTAHNDVQRHKAALEAGFNTVLCKPLMAVRAQHLLDIYVMNPAFSENVVPALEQGSNDIIDWDLSLSMVNGRESLACELLNALVTTFPAEKKAITQAFDTQDVQAVRAVLHRFHGGLCYLGVPRMMAAVQSLQQQLKNTQDLQGCQAQLNALFAEMDALNQAWQQFLSLQPLPQASS